MKSILEAKQQFSESVDCMTSRCSSYTKNPNKDFTRNRKLGINNLTYFLVLAGTHSLKNELREFFDQLNDAPSVSALVQQRAKLSPTYFRDLFYEYNKRCDDSATYNGYHLYAVDGTCINISRDKTSDTYVAQSGTAGHNYFHANCLFDLCNGTFQDVDINTPYNANERTGLVELINRFDFSEKSIVICDRGYPSYNVIAHFDALKCANYLMRVSKNSFRDVAKLPKTELDVILEFGVTTTQTKKDKEEKRILIQTAHPTTPEHSPLMNRKWDFGATHDFKIRVVQFYLSNGELETIVTNLDQKEFPADKIKELYGLRWEIETSFRDIKYATGINNLHAKNEDYVLQEIYCRFIYFNLEKRILSRVETDRKNTKYKYKANFKSSVVLCKEFVLGRINAETLIMEVVKDTIPIRDGRQDKRKRMPKGSGYHRIFA